MKIAKKTILSLVVVSLALFLPAAARADWGQAQFFQSVQGLYLTPNGMDINVTFPGILADDLKSSANLWSERRHPEGYDYQGDTIDLAFVITPEPATLLVLALGLVPALTRPNRRVRAWARERHRAVRDDL